MSFRPSFCEGIAVFGGVLLIFFGLGGFIFAGVSSGGYDYFNRHFNLTRCRYLNATLGVNGTVVPVFEVANKAGIPFSHCDSGSICHPDTCCTGGDEPICRSCTDCSKPEFSNVICTNFNGSKTQKLGPYPWNQGQYLPQEWYPCYTTTLELPFMANATGCTSWTSGCVMMSRKVLPSQMNPHKFWGILIGIFITPAGIGAGIVACGGLGYLARRQSRYESF